MYEWTLTRWSAQRARRYLTGLRGAISSLRHRPNRHPKAPDAEAFNVEVRQMVFGRGRGRYRILYSVTESSVTILKIRHTARKPLA
ncbi:type II toxin-antitoxin system RelE/ParE family toxin [Candidatus Sumerlaeota bacterium]|nr:type II toxin-antitoxin system RelE/ParE family toxin [Candidatus Sumerlaeota bacterium]